MTAFSSIAELAVAELPAPVRALACEAASFAAAGQSAQLAQPVAAAAYSLAGQQAALSPSIAAAPAAMTLGGQPIASVLSAVEASFALSGQAAIGTDAMIAAPAVFALAGQKAQLAQAVSAATFALAGQTVALATRATAAVAAFAISPQTAAYTVTGVWAVTAYALTGKTAAIAMPVAEASFSFIGKAAELSWPTPGASFALSGQQALYSAVALFDPASFALSGVAAQEAYPTAPASFALTGESILTAHIDVSAPAAFDLFGGPVFWIYTIGLNIPGEPAIAEYALAEFPRHQTYGVQALATSYSWTGQAALLTTSPEAQGFTLTGQAAQEAMPVQAGAFVANGQSLLAAIRATIDPSAFDLSVNAPPLLTLLQGSFDLAGKDALLIASLLRGDFVLTAVPAARVDWMAAAPASFAFTGKTSLFDVGLALTRGTFSLFGFSVSDITGPTGDHIYLIEVQAHDGVSLQTFYLATEGFTSHPSDTPANQFYDPRIVDPGNFERALFDGTNLRGRATLGIGDIRIASSDPGNGVVLDDWLNYGWSKRDIRIKSLPKGAKSLGAASTLFVGKLNRISSTKPLEYLDLQLSDRLSDLQLPLLTDLFAGTTTSSGATAEGNSDLEGKIKQRCWGSCANVPLQPANPYDLIYLASNGEVHSIALYDGGVALTNDGDDADLATLQAASVTGGHYRTCLALGLVKVGSLPTFALTADVVEGATGADRTAGQIALRMLTAYGISSSAISTGSIDELDDLNDAECCYFVDDDRDALSAIQDVLDSIGAWMVPDRDGTFVFGRLDEPGAAQKTYELDDEAITDSLDRVDNDLPAWRVLVQYGPVFQVQGDNDLAGAVTAERRAYLAKDFRTTAAQDTSVQTKHLSAREVTLTTYLVNASDAAAEATRQLALLSADRQRYEVTFPLSDAFADAPGTSIALKNARLGLSSGKLFNVIRRVDQYATEKVQLSLWG